MAEPLQLVLKFAQALGEGVVFAAQTHDPNRHPQRKHDEDQQEQQNNQSFHG